MILIYCISLGLKLFAKNKNIKRICISTKFYYFEMRKFMSNVRAS